MRIVISRAIVALTLLVPMSVMAQPAGAGSAAPPAAGSADAAPAVAQPVMPKVPDAPAPAAADLRATCAAAMNADPTFADAIVKSINEDTYRQHARAADAIAKNERHVILAYGAMWVLSALFLVFVWRRHQGLKSEIVQLRRDLEAATSESKR